MPEFGSEKNLALWDAVEKTDSAYTKEYSGAGGFSGTSINVTYLVKKATKYLGALGIGWGYEIEEERYDSGAPLSVKGEPAKDAEGMTVRAMVHTIKLKFWYRDPQTGDRGELVHYGHTPYVYANKYGVQTDMEAPKKSLTDALKKCLSMLGFAGDIFMGLYDDIHYLNEIRDEFAIKKADDKVAEKAKQESEFEDWYAKVVEQVENAVNMTMLEAVFKGAARKLAYRKDDIKLMELTKLKDARREHFEKLANAVKPQKAAPNKKAAPAKNQPVTEEKSENEPETK